LRELVLPTKPADDLVAEKQSGNKVYSMNWAPRLKRVFAIEIEKCEKCVGELKIIAFIEDTEIVEKILKHRGWMRSHKPRIVRRQPGFLSTQDNYSDINGR